MLVSRTLQAGGATRTKVQGFRKARELHQLPTGPQPRGIGPCLGAGIVYSKFLLCSTLPPWTRKEGSGVDSLAQDCLFSDWVSSYLLSHYQSLKALGFTEMHTWE